MASEETVRHETVLDNVGQHVAKVYAEALLRAAAGRGQGREILEELDALIDNVFRREPALEVLLGSPAVGRESKAAVLRQTFEGRANELLVDFLLVLNAHDRLDLLGGIVRVYRDLFDRSENRMQVRVSSAAPLPDDQRQRLLDELRAAFGKEPILNLAVEPDLLGGLVVQVDDWVYDSSVRSRLEAIRKQLVERSSHAIQSGRDRFSTANGD
jgi:F-type H+-transporting ATPase subunit delta